MSKACYRHIDNVHGLNTYDYGALDDAILVLKSSFSAEDRIDGEPNIIVRTKR
mgnify:CR=1 FL=1